MKCSPLTCTWLSFLLAIPVITNTNASTVSPSTGRRGIFFGRSNAASPPNATTVNSTSQEINDNESKGGRGFLFGFGRKNEEQTSSDVRSVSEQSTNNQTSPDDAAVSKATKENNNNNKTNIDGKSSTHTANATPTNQIGKATKGRGPFGFFKPVDQVKKTIQGKDDTPLSNKDNATVAEDVSETNTTSLDIESLPNNDKIANKNESSTPSSNTTQSQDSPALGLPKPRFIILGPPGSNDGFPPRPMPARYSHNRGFPPPTPALDHQALIAASVGAVINAATRIWLIVWLAKRLSAEDELLTPEQHFRWECLNDRYSKDATVLEHVFARPPLGISSLKWGRYLKKLRPQNSTSASTGPQLPTRNVIVVDITPSGSLDITYLTDVVNFLVASHTMSQFGPDPEIVLLLESPGGGVSTYGLAASQVGRLKQMGLNVTICIDMVAASGGYMIATQATKLVAAPFAQLGSIGVMAEGLNFNQLLNQYGVKPMVLKAGEQKNRLSAFGPVTDDDLQAETQKLEKIHEAFIEMCLTERPSLDPSICDGTVMVASQGIQHGIVDRVLTSEEYIWECIQDGAHVLKLHKASMRPHPNYFLFRAMDLLPHLKKTIRELDTGKLVSLAFQAAAVAGVVVRSLR